jgi:hypothetical protein
MGWIKTYNLSGDRQGLHRKIHIISTRIDGPLIDMGKIFTSEMPRLIINIYLHYLLEPGLVDLKDPQRSQQVSCNNLRNFLI